MEGELVYVAARVVRAQGDVLNVKLEDGFAGNEVVVDKQAVRVARP